MNVDWQLIQELNALIRKRGIDVLELTTREVSLRLERATPSRVDSRQMPPSFGKTTHHAPSPSDAPVKPAQCHEINAPMPAIYLDRHPLADQPLARPGDSIEAHQLIGFLQVGCLLLPLRSDHAGRLLSVVPKAGDTLDYGSIIMRLEADVRI